MKTKTFLVILTALGVMALAFMMTACGSSKEGDNAYSVEKNTQPKQSTSQKDDSITEKKELQSSDENIRPPEGWIKSAKLIQHKQGREFFWKINAETFKPLKKNQYLTYVYFIDHEKSTERSEDLIPLTETKKGNMVSAEVIFNQDEQVLQRKRTSPIMVGNMAPEIENVTFPDMRGPGTYTFTVSAHDQDEDPITFGLEAPSEKETLDSNLQIDASTGNVTYVLTESAKPKILKFIITANDGDGGKTKKVVSVGFKEEKVMKDEESPQTTEEEKGENT